MAWKKIEDAKVRHTWVSNPDCCECEVNDTEPVLISPTFYQDNGEPICMCGTDMIYSHTEIKE